MADSYEDSGGGMTARDIFSGAFRKPQAPVVDIGGQAARVGKFSISGVSRIRAGFLNDLLQRTFAATTVKQVADEAREAAGRLQALGVAKQAVVEVDAGSDGRLDVHFRCVDGSRFAVRTGVDVGGAEGTASIVARMGNVWGGGESLEANYARGTQTAAAFRAVLAVPLAADPQRRVELSASQASTDCRPYAAHDELRRALSAAVVRRRGCTQHELAYALAWREVRGLGHAASPSLRALAGHSVKSGFAYTCTRDDRDSQTVPTRGSLVRAVAEVAGLGGSVRLAKAQVELQANRAVAPGYVLAVGAQAGALWAEGRPALADRFFLGGAHSVRGFEYRGIGPRDGSDSVGGDAFYAVGLSLLTPLPHVDALRGHVWANAGQCALLGANAGQLARFVTSPSAAVGVGLVYRHSMVRAEVSWCVPVAAAHGDRLRAGVQFGLEFQFL
ncbi:hypothetical protein H4S07_004871 [Coemansia furcata]|uniref:Uncharacterized protein n=1 Tax=Coemansia furcata TaxID=417177 RepID=A0ACC1L674_9FUNG|nr:hypothetical protein H4S07_004871 [Coemansia furcata]